MSKRLLGGGGSGVPDLITILVVDGPEGTIRPDFIGEGDQPSDETSYADMDALTAAVDRLILEKYSGRAPEQGIDVQYAWYPLGDRTKGGKAAGMPGDYLTFEVSKVFDRYRASLTRGGEAFVEADTLEDLADSIDVTARQRWPALGDGDIPGMVRWGRTLAAGGFGPERDRSTR